jgi:hypothetical protein
MIYRQLISFLCFFCALNAAFAQGISEKKWGKGIAVSGFYNRMSSNFIQNSSNDFNLNSISANDRIWTFEHQTGLAFGIFGKRIFRKNFSLQGALNVQWSRQKVILTETLTPVPSGQFFFQSQITTNGTMNFNNLYLQIPLTINVNIDKKTAIEGGLFFNQSLANNSSQNLDITTFAFIKVITGERVELNKPLVVKKTDQPELKNSLGWLLGVNYALNDRISVIVRYESTVTSGISNFQELRENRMLAGLLFNVH